jgi:hypothetical protein
MKYKEYHPRPYSFQKHNIWFVHHIPLHLCFLISWFVSIFFPILDYPFPNDQNMKCHNFHWDQFLT